MLYQRITLSYETPCYNAKQMHCTLFLSFQTSHHNAQDTHFIKQLNPVP